MWQSTYLLGFTDAIVVEFHHGAHHLSHLMALRMARKAAFRFSSSYQRSFVQFWSIWFFVSYSIYQGQILYTKTYHANAVGTFFKHLPYWLSTSNWCQSTMIQKKKTGRVPQRPSTANFCHTSAVLILSFDLLVNIPGAVWSSIFTSVVASDIRCWVSYRLKTMNSCFFWNIPSQTCLSVGSCCSHLFPQRLAALPIEQWPKAKWKFASGWWIAMYMPGMNRMISFWICQLVFYMDPC